MIFLIRKADTSTGVEYIKEGSLQETTEFMSEARRFTAMEIVMLGALGNLPEGFKTLDLQGGRK